MIRYAFSFFIFLLSLSSCIQKTSQEQNNESSTTTGRREIQQKLIDDGIAISTQLQQTLAAHLKRAVEDSGVAYALNYCNLQAYQLTDSIAQMHGVNIKRVSHKARNLLNKAEENELKVINDFQAALDRGETAFPKITEGNEHSTFFAPIMIQSPLCLKCHGEPETDIAPEDFIVIKMLYPKDEATGFKLNDLRGMWRIDFTKKLQAL